MNNNAHATSRQHSVRFGLAAFVTPLALGLAAETIHGDTSGQPVIEVTGVVRDFIEESKAGGHPDFEVMPEDGFGVFTANVAQSLGAAGKPVFTGMGARLVQPFRDADDNPIAPHLYNRHFECQIVGPDQECVQLTHQSGGALGYSTYEVCFMGVEFNPDGTSTWQYEVKQIAGQNLSHWTLWMDPGVDIKPGTTAGWQWIGDDHPNFPGPGVKWDTNGGVGDGQLFTVVLGGQYFGTNESWVQVKGGGGTPYALAPFFGPGTKASTNGTPYELNWELVPDSTLEDQPGEFYGLGTGGVTSAETFHQWFRDTPGVNMSMPLTLRFVRQSDGSYLFDDSLDPAYAHLNGFFPIENQLLGQSGGSPNRNFHFTWELHANFTYDSSKNSFIELTSTDDAWVFINGMLVIDLGGVHGPETQRFGMNRMCLNDGQLCTISIFVADRHRPNSRLRIHSDLEFEGKPIPTVTALYD